MLPEFIFVGPTKTGTSWIDIYLRNRPEILLPSTLKESCFFDKRYEKGLEWYESLFEHEADGVCIEVAPTYFAKAAAAKRVAADVPGVTVICTLRDPLDRAVSHYFHYLKCGEPDVGFEKMLAKHKDLIDSGEYFKNLQMWQSLLGPDRVHILMYDQMKQDIDGFCQNVCRILGIPFEPPSQTIARVKVNEAGIPRYRHLAKVARKMADSLRGMGAGRVVNHFRPLRRSIFGTAHAEDRKDDIRNQAHAFLGAFTNEYSRLEEEFGLDLSSWRDRSERVHANAK